MSRNLLPYVCRTCQIKPTRLQLRQYSSTRLNRATETTTAPSNTAPAREFKPISEKISQLAQQAANEAKSRPRSGVGPDEPYHITVYAHKQNTIVAFTDPGRDIICTYSCGSLCLRHAQRKTFDASYQLASFLFRKMAEKSWKIGGKKSAGATYMLNSDDVRRRGIELVFRGYGTGREAFSRAVLGSEGRLVKPLITTVTDNTRLKFGGVRSPAVRRLWLSFRICILCITIQYRYSSACHLSQDPLLR